MADFKTRMSTLAHENLHNNSIETHLKLAKATIRAAASGGFTLARVPVVEDTYKMLINQLELLGFTVNYKTTYLEVSL